MSSPFHIIGLRPVLQRTTELFCNKHSYRRLRCNCFGAAFLGSAGKKGKGKKGKASSSAPGPQDQKLNHSLDMIDAFSKLKVVRLL